jgi:hypothetical protein
MGTAITMKKKIDIEKALRWALIDEMPKGRAVSADIGALIGRRFQHQRFNLGSGMTPSIRGDVDALGFVPGAPHEDAEKIADVVARLDTVARFDEVREVSALFGDLAPIAGDAIAAIMTAQFNPQALVIALAISGKRPRWQFASPTPYQMRIDFRDKLGSLRQRSRVVGIDAAGDIVDLVAQRGREAMKSGLYDLAFAPRSPLQWDNPSMIQIGHARAEYLAWYSALVSLAEKLRDALVEFEILPPVVTRLPWISGQTPESRVLGDGGSMTVPLALQPKRKAPGKPLESDIAMKSRKKRRILPKACPAKNAAFSGY